MKLKLINESSNVLQSVANATTRTRMPLTANEIIVAANEAGADLDKILSSDINGDLRGLIIDFPDLIPHGQYSFYKGGGEYGHMTTDLNLAKQYGEPKQIIVNYHGERTTKWQMANEASGQALFAPGLPKLMLLWGDLDGICQVVRLE